MNNTRNYRLLLDTAVLAGEIMLESGAETYRVEDTINRMLGVCHVDHVEALVMSTSIIATISDPSMDALTLVRRITNRETFLNRIYLVNDVSRNLCDGKIDIETAHNRLLTIKETKQYANLLNSICIIIITALFPVLLGGSYKDTLVGIVSGIVLATIIYICDKIKLNSFVTNSIGGVFMAIIPIIIHRVMGPNTSTDLIIIGSIMSLVPGVAVTNAVRDTLQGDFVSGVSRLLEAFVKALAIVLGVGTGLAICGGF